jgi:hypothetical protein
MSRTAHVTNENIVTDLLKCNDGAFLVRQDQGWAVVSGQPSGGIRLGSLDDEIVARLRDRQLLVETSDGRLMPKPRAAVHGLDRRPPAGGEGAGAVLNDAESPLSWLRSRKDKSGRPLIGEDQYLAGERLRADFERAKLAKRVTSTWDLTAAAGRSAGNAAADVSDGALAARQRFHAALDAVGPELGSILYQVCCLAAGIEQAERLLELPQRSGKAVLGLGLSALARHYGLVRGQAAVQGARHWAMPDYRPPIGGPGDA